MSTVRSTLGTVQEDYMFVESKALEMDVRITKTVSKVTDLEGAVTGYLDLRLMQVTLTYV